MTRAGRGLRWGILATGAIAELFAADARAAGIDLAAVGSRAQESAEAFARRFDIARIHGSYRELLTDDQVDIVYIATPHPYHAQLALAAIAQGKHVLVEKPFALTGDEAEQVRGAAAAAGVLAMEAMWTRYLPHMTRIRRLVRSGALGEVRAVLADHTQRLSDDPAHRLNALELGGGALLDLAVYPVAFAWDLLGAPTTVTAHARLGPTGADTEIGIVMTHRTGALSTSISSSRAAGPNMAAAVGTEARIQIDPVWYGAAPFRLIAADGAVIEEFAGAVTGRGMQYQALAAEEYVASGALDSDVLPIAESVAIMRCLDEIRGQVGVHYPQEESP